MDNWTTAEGSPSPLGVTWIEDEQAYNVALYSKHATGVTLLLFADADQLTPFFQYRHDFLSNKSGRVWHCRIPERRLGGARYYGYCVEGPFNPAEGHRFDPQKLLLDPSARAVVFPTNFSLNAACEAGSNIGRAPHGKRRVLARMGRPGGIATYSASC